MALCMSGYRRSRLFLLGTCVFFVAATALVSKSEGFAFSVGRILFDIRRQITPGNQVSKVTEGIDLLGITACASASCGEIKAETIRRRWKT